jgi:alpha 1,3-glucosidase
VPKLDSASEIGPYLDDFVYFCIFHLFRETLLPREDYRLEDVTWGQSGLSGKLQSMVHSKQNPLTLSISILLNGLVRMTVDEVASTRYRIHDVIEPTALQSLPVVWKHEDSMSIGNFFTSTDRYKIAVSHYPFNVTYFRNDNPIVVANGNGKLNFEQTRQPNPKPADESQQISEHDLAFSYDIDGMWEESFGGHTDKKKNGPASVSMDFTFVGSQHIYGIPEHATSFALKTTNNAGGYHEPYRLFNLDVFEYELDSPMALYGAVPFAVSHSATDTVGVFWLNAAETYVDVVAEKPSLLASLLGSDTPPSMNTHWISETGLLDVFLVPGPTPKQLFDHFTQLTGRPSLPPLFATVSSCRDRNKCLINF